MNGVPVSFTLEAPEESLLLSSERAFLVLKYLIG
jgi:hypothetical protein